MNTSALLLAAGKGERLAEESGGLPKCLLEFGNQSLLQRHIETLCNNGIRDIYIVVGYQRQQIETCLPQLAEKFAVNISTVINESFAQGSMLSLHCGLRDGLPAWSGQQLLLMDADVLYAPQLMQTLLQSTHENCLLLDKDFIPGDEPVKVCIRGNRIVEFGKKVATNLLFDWQGESVGFFRLGSTAVYRLQGLCEEYIDNDELSAPYEKAIRDLICHTETPFGWEESAQLPWIEIDFPADMQRAQTEILPQIAKAKDSKG